MLGDESLCKTPLMVRRRCMRMRTLLRTRKYVEPSDVCSLAIALI